MGKTPKELRITALMIIRNEEIYLEKSLSHLIDSGLSVAVIDNQSTDNSVRIIKSYIDRGMPVKLYHYPFTGKYDWEDLLRKTEEIAHQIKTDWFILTAPDEIMVPPLPFKSLSEGIRFVDRKGYNVINFDEFVFVPSNYDESFIGKDYEKEMRYYYFHEPYPLRLMRAWKPCGKNFNLTKSGSHKVLFKHQQIFPDNFILKHYIFLSYENGVQKYASRIFVKEAINRGWHYNRYYLSSLTIQLPSVDEMKELKEKQQFDKSDPKKNHLFIRIPADSAGGEFRLNLREMKNIFLPEALKWDKKQKVCFILTYDLKSLEPMMPFLLSITRTPLINNPDGLSSFIKTILKKIEQDQASTFENNEFPLEYCQGPTENEQLAYLVDITSENHSVIPAIQLLIPTSKFIHVVQNINDMDLSSFNLNPTEFKKFCMGWAEYIKETRQNSQYCQEFLELKVEDLRNDPMRFHKELCSFLDVPWNDDYAKRFDLLTVKNKEIPYVKYPEEINSLIQYWRIELGYEKTG